MMAMFNGAAKANPNVANWDTRNVTDIEQHVSPCNERRSGCL